MLDETEWPIANYAAPKPTDAEKRAKREAKGKKYDRSRLKVDPSDNAGVTALGDVADLTIPAFPVMQSTAIIIGEIIAAEAYLSNDKTGIYSEFTIHIDEVFKNAGGYSLVSGGTVEAEREGGRVRFPSGRIQRFSLDRLRMPRLGRRYILFLTSDNEQGFHILTGYELQQSKVLPLDDLPYTKSYKNVDEASFLSELRERLTTNSSSTK
ncbi:MAG TPA: hypothetical protein VM911_16920 [Pyrinomonadaceae bacterium]|jgi:hypothetical protein|nr:hypothetical protein [Pyrinomonadaceae bacterium]